MYLFQTPDLEVGPSNWPLDVKKDPVNSKKLKNKKIAYAGIITLDIIILDLCLLGSFYLNTSLLFKGHTTGSSLLTFLLISNVLWILVAFFTDIYRVFDEFRLLLKIRDLFMGSLIYFGLLSLIHDYILYADGNRKFLLPALMGFLVLTSFVHYGLRMYYRSHSRLLLYAVVGGAPSQIKYLKKALAKSYGPNSYCVGRFGRVKFREVNNLGSASTIRDYLQDQSNEINKLIYFRSELTQEEVQQIVRLCRGRFIEFEVIPDGVDFFNKGVQVEQLSHLPIFRRKREPLCLVKNIVLKRAFDIVVSSLVILFIFPWMFPIIALLIRLESPGPIFFTQDRTGYWNKPFKLIKFRTMSVNAECNERQAIVGDCRITKVGAFLRKMSLDEFPQFLNVLKGEMSVVGPRPHMLKHTEDYSSLIESFMIRHEVKPGITGWAQINGWRGPTDDAVYKMMKRVEHDVSYIESWSFWFDCKCILLTLTNIARGELNAF